MPDRFAVMQHPVVIPMTTQRKELIDADPPPKENISSDGLSVRIQRIVIGIEST